MASGVVESPCTAASEVSKLLEYARQTPGFDFLDSSLAIRDGERGRGVFATVAIAKGTPLITIPSALAVRPLDAMAQRIASGECSRLLALVLTVVHGIHFRCEENPFFALLQTSPPPDCPLLWEEAQLRYLEGTSLLQQADGSGAAASKAAASAREAFHGVVLPLMKQIGEALLPSSVQTQRAFATALSWVASRAVLGRVAYEYGSACLWPYLKADGPQTDTRLVLLPVFDLLNTSSDPSALCARLSQAAGGGGHGGAGEAGEAGWTVTATRDIAPGDEILLSYGAHGPAELLRTYGILEGSPDVAPAAGGRGARGGGGASSVPRGNPHTSVDFAREEVVRAVRLSRQRRLEQDEEDADDDDDDDDDDQQAASGAAVLSEATASERLQAVEAAGLLPVCFTVRAEVATAADGGGADLADVLPAHLLTLVQVLLMNDEEYAEWRGPAGRILLGRDYLDHEQLPHVIGALLELAECRLRALAAADERLAASGTGGDEGVTLAARFGRGLRAAERAVLVNAFKRAVLTLEAAVGEEEEEEEDEGESDESDDDDNDDNEEEEGESEAGGKRRRTA